jgi:hypothetical protein
VTVTQEPDTTPGAEPAEAALPPSAINQVRERFAFLRKPFAIPNDASRGLHAIADGPESHPGDGLAMRLTLNHRPITGRRPSGQRRPSVTTGGEE